MDYFSQIDEGKAIVRSRGVYRQADLYERGGKVYAKYGGGFVRLLPHGATTSPNVMWNEFDTPHGVAKDAGGHVTYKPNTKAKAA